jgi:hypothetical protein
MKRSIFLCLCAGTLYAQTSTVTYESYNPTTGGFDLQPSIVCVPPDSAVFGPGPYPLFMHVPGTFEDYNGNVAMLFVNQMAARGFMSASVQYLNTETQQSCLQYAPRAQGIFDPTLVASP